VEDEADLFAAGSQRVGHRLADEHLAQVADVDVARGADTSDHHVRALPEPFGDPLGPAGYGDADVAHLKLHFLMGFISKFGKA
jgi:hypothetical protein